MSGRFERMVRMGAVLATAFSLLFNAFGGASSALAQADTSSESGVSGSSYTSPSFGYSLNWDGSWTVKDEKVEADYNMLRLDDDSSILYIEGYSPAIDTTECVTKYGVDYVSNIDGVTNLTSSDPAENAGVVSSDITFTFTFQDDSGADQTLDMSAYVSCQADDSADINIVVTHLGATAEWDAETEARAELLGTLSTEGAGAESTPSDDGNADVTVTPVTSTGASDYTGLLQNVAGDGDLPDNSDDLLALFASSINDINNYWAREFPILTGGLHYVPPAAYVPFVGALDTPCGPANSFDEATGSGSGPFYCPSDQTVYIDMGFANYQFDAVANVPFLIPAVLAHETGHHVQTLLGMQDCVATPCLDPNQLTSQEIEYMADCYGGAWSQDAENRGRLGENDVDANIVQYAVILGGGSESADPGGHGRGAERIWWFLNGYLDGAAKCYETSSVTKDWAQTGPPNPLAVTQDEPNPTPAAGNPTATAVAQNSDLSQLGDVIESSEGALTITKTDTDTSIDNSTADGIFLIVFLEVDRGADMTGPFNYANWSLTDESGTAYDLDQRATDVLLKSAYTDGMDEVLTGGEGYKIAMVFDVPQDASGFTLVNADENIQVQLDK
jgi:uncharacterized protein